MAALESRFCLWLRLSIFQHLRPAQPFPGRVAAPFWRLLLYGGRRKRFWPEHRGRGGRDVRLCALLGWPFRWPHCRVGLHLCALPPAESLRARQSGGKYGFCLAAALPVGGARNRGARAARASAPDSRACAQLCRPHVHQQPGHRALYTVAGRLRVAIDRRLCPASQCRPPHDSVGRGGLGFGCNVAFPRPLGDCWGWG